MPGIGLPECGHVCFVLYIDSFLMLEGGVSTSTTLVTFSERTQMDPGRAVGLMKLVT